MQNHPAAMPWGGRASTIPFVSLLLPILLALPTPACTGETSEVNGTPTEAAPEVSAFRDTVGDDAVFVAVLDQLPLDSNGDFDLTYGDGSTWSGNVDLSSGAFSTVLQRPADYYMIRLSQTGTLSFGESGYIDGADYRELREYIDGTETDYLTTFELGFGTNFNRLTIVAKDGERDITIDSTYTLLIDREVLDETWDQPNGFHEVIETIYYKTGGIAATQSWTRDERRTAVAPDRTGEFVFFADFSGEGELVWYYDHGIYQIYSVLLESNGAYQSSEVYEDPGTVVSPDGQGIYSLQADYSGSGLYTEQYDDGSGLREDYLFFADGSTDVLFRFDDASTPFDPDTDGDTHYEYDGTGDGHWRRHSAAGVVETCAYEFDSAGTITILTCE